MHRYTIKDLVSLCKELKGKSPAEARKIGEREHLSRKYIDTLRILLGYTRNRVVPFDKAFVNEVVKNLRAGMNCSRAAKKYGLNPTTVYLWARKNGIDYLTRNFWTPRKIIFLVQAIKAERKGGPNMDRENARRIGASLATFRNMKYRLNAHSHCRRWIEIAEKAGLYNA